MEDKKIFATLDEAIKEQADEIMEKMRHDKKMEELYQPTQIQPNQVER